MNFFTIVDEDKTTLPAIGSVDREVRDAKTPFVESLAGKTFFAGVAAGFLAIAIMKKITRAQ